ncbi:DUF1643 domain-containing protein [Mycobacterium phage Purky]|uniref:DUF1643 domain-containing protein n=1 Tax=Mycobacterium phage Purky TaxID=2593351 RepID=A0A514TWT4_9CAUD|nr:DUF1643 domain-containing protein [Mycobacterium phage Purky]QDK01163.1 hypothetical protein SEA_PURKY_59 [Mycobacterium phage Purky]
MTDQLALPVTANTAIISECGRYRYELRRVWDPKGPLLEFVMLNPSTADADVDDPTIRRCIGFARRWGYGGIVVHNLYAYRATNPDMLANVDDPIGPENRDYLANQIADCTVFAWGAHPAAIGWFNGYPYDIRPAISRRTEPLCLGLTSTGMPRHPLYIRADATPFPWEQS